MIQNFILTALFTASIAVVWRNLLTDIPALHAWIGNNLPRVLSKAIRCGFCSTYWISFIVVIIFNPFGEYMPLLRISMPDFLLHIGAFLFAWMSVGMVAVFIRFIYIAIQEFVHYELHTLNKEDSPHEH